MKSLLADTHLFSSFTTKEMQNIHEMSAVVHHKSEHVLFQQGQEFRSFYYIVSGMVKLSRITEQGEEKVIEIIRDKQYFAEALMFLEKPVYPVQATIIKDSEIIAIDSYKYLKILKSSSTACFDMLGIMSQRMHHLIIEIEELTLHSTKCRLASYLLKHACLKHSNSYALDLPKNTIASRLSMKPETFSRALHHFHDCGLIVNSKNHIKIIDKKALENFIHQEKVK